MSAPVITKELIAKHGLTDEEYARIQGILGRDPNITELGVFSVMWSEHCSYKNTKRELRKFPTTGPLVLVKAGEENAGVIDIGDGWAVAFKMESHNHPSAIEPFQGAATGVGGIIRDIFTMGARPVFSLDSLRFGPIHGDTEQHKWNRSRFAGVVSGIAHYGNCIGVPTIGGEVFFDESYNGNPLVNVFCLGILKHEQIARGAAKGVGNPVFYVGAETGRDGLAGAAFASRDLTEESKQDRPAVQVGDPFREKLLLEACLELLATDAVAGIQDMGAAGLTCSTCETASRGGTGVEIDLAKVPQRETGMTPYETLLSESQERMLIIVKKGHEQTVVDIFEKWDLPYAEVGVVKDDGMMRVLDHGKLAVEIPAAKLADDAPLYSREWKARPEPAPLDFSKLAAVDEKAALLALLAHPTIASKQWVWRQFDHMVRLGCAVLPGSDAAVFIVREANKILAATSDCNSLYVLQDPREGARIAIAEAARNLTCSGARLLAVTDNLNFANPHNPELFWQLRESVEGLAEGCREFGTPVTGGNVSLYNQSPAGPIDPTPTVGMVGIIDDAKHITTQAFKSAGDVIILAGPVLDPAAGDLSLGASHYMKVVHGQKAGRPPRLSFDLEKRVQAAVLGLIRDGLVKSAHDCSEGGLAVALAESCIGGKLGATVELPSGPALDKYPAHAARAALLFGESQSRIILGIAPENADRVLAALAAAKIPHSRLGIVGGDKLSITAHGATLAAPLTEVSDPFEHSIERAMEG
ncbi:MAG: phosphoribosylformylglycinamidine synthase subunit PurL [Verrucomicrobia bacterium]|nr:phosphoribosylformylglycinamidine synthase subunit PurL [Verrucomicrobiota bacterium]